MKTTRFSGLVLAFGLASCALGQQTEIRQSTAAGITDPKVISKVGAEYSEQARAAGIRGKVVIRLDVGLDGLAHNLQVTRTLGSLDQRAIEAVRRWRFQPGTKDNAPVVASASVEVDFNLAQSFGQESAFHRFARQAFEHAVEAINFNLELRERDVKEIDRFKNSSKLPEVQRALENEIAQLAGAIQTATEKINVLEYRMAHADDCAQVYMATFRKADLSRAESGVMQVCQSADLYPPQR